MIKLPGGFGVVDFTDWAYGLIAAIIVGGSNAIVAGVAVTAIDPDHFAAGTDKFFKLISVTFAMSGGLGMFAYLAKRPLPLIKKMETTVQSREIEGKPTVTLTTLKETVFESTKPEEPTK